MEAHFAVGKGRMKRHFGSLSSPCWTLAPASTSVPGAAALARRRLLTSWARKSDGVSSSRLPEVDLRAPGTTRTRLEMRGRKPAAWDKLSLLHVSPCGQSLAAWLLRYWGPASWVRFLHGAQAPSEAAKKSRRWRQKARPWTGAWKCSPGLGIEMACSGRGLTVSSRRHCSPFRYSRHLDGFALAICALEASRLI